LGQQLPASQALDEAYVALFGAFGAGNGSGSPPPAVRQPVVIVAADRSSGG
jgi:hypothetical protein